MMNNPMFSLMQAMQSGKNPNFLLQQMAQGDPRVRQIMDMTRGKNPQQLRQMAENMAKERGMNIDDIARQLGITIPSNR